MPRGGTLQAGTVARRFRWSESRTSCKNNLHRASSMSSQNKKMKQTLDIALLKGQCPDYAHARASSVFSSKDNRTVILTRQDFLPDRTADRDLLFIFSSNILDFRRSLSSYLKFGSRHGDSSNFIASRAASRPKNLLPLAVNTGSPSLLWALNNIILLS